jgi:enamine deaminase RidA (YjgF/YER057c/UK114 family)
MPHTYINPEAVNKPAAYTQVVVPKGSQLVFFAGQVPLDKDGRIVGIGDLAAQAEQVFENIKDCLASVGATFHDVTKITTFIVDYKPEYRYIFADVRKRYIQAENPPASTLLGVQSLSTPGYMIEIEVVAVLP